MKLLNSKKMKELDTSEIQRAIWMIEEAKEIIDEALRGTEEEPSYRAYGSYGLDQVLGNGNRYDRSLFDLIDAEV